MDHVVLRSSLLAATLQKSVLARPIFFAPQALHYIFNRHTGPDAAELVSSRFVSDVDCSGALLGQVPSAGVVAFSSPRRHRRPVLFIWRQTDAAPNFLLGSSLTLKREISFIF